MSEQNTGPIGTLELNNRIGMRMTLPIDSLDDAYAKMRQYGAQGWISGGPPAGGYTLPYCMADTFDFSLIGAREWEIDEADLDNPGQIKKRKVLLYMGEMYKRREKPATTGAKRMPARIWYSRGSTTTDDETNVEAKDNGKGYVTLIEFKGGGKEIPELMKPAAKDKVVA